MPISPSSTLLRPDLGSSFEEFDLAASAAGFIGSQVLPVFSTPLQTANFSVITLESLLENRALKRAPGTGYSRGSWEFEQTNFATIERGCEEPVDDRERSIYAFSFDAERIAADRARLAVLRNLEIDIAAAIFNTSTWTGSSLTTAVSTEWSTAATATPVADILAAKQSVRASCGMDANTVIMSQKVYENATKTAEVVDRIKYSGLDDPKSVGPQALAALFQVERVLVAGGSTVKLTSTKGQTGTLGDIWDDEYCMVARTASGQDLREACVGRLFVFDGSGDATVEQYRDEAIRSEIIRVRMDYHAKVLRAECGHLLSNITA